LAKNIPWYAKSPTIDLQRKRWNLLEYCSILSILASAKCLITLDKEEYLPQWPNGDSTPRAKELKT